MPGLGGVTFGMWWLHGSAWMRQPSVKTGCLLREARRVGAYGLRQNVDLRCSATSLENSVEKTGWGQGRGDDTQKATPENRMHGRGGQRKPRRASRFPESPVLGALRCETYSCLQIRMTKALTTQLLKLVKEKFEQEGC